MIVVILLLECSSGRSGLLTFVFLTHVLRLNFNFVGYIMFTVYTVRPYTCVYHFGVSLT